ncbi:MAG: M23 family metallopeptidase [Alphaproteobacteria bacterium]|nr:M23 family metallopeptidase [Alphaproteobacteria bacterium]
MKIFVCLLFVSLVAGCASNRIPLLNYSLNTWWGGSVSNPSSVVVKKGDTLYSIARRYDVPLREVIEANNLRPPYALQVGQKIRMPKAKYHEVCKGDTLYSISKRYNVDMSSLSRTNNLRSPYSLRVGQKLLLPGAVVSRPQATHYVANTPKATSKWQPKTQKSTTKKTSARRSSYTPPVKKRTTKFAWPVQGKVISKYGVIAKGRNNDGINIKAALGTTVKAADAGTVAYAGNELKGFGNLILIKHNDGWITAYAHNDRLVVRKGQKVRRGEKIATVGSSGGVSAPQLHFEIRAGKKAVNPLSYLP